MTEIEMDPHPFVAVAVAVFTLSDDSFDVLLVRRESGETVGNWSLPGGSLRLDESLDGCAGRVLAEQTNISNVQLKQFNTFGVPSGNPYNYTVSVAYFALAPFEDVDIKADVAALGDLDAIEVGWFPVFEIPELDFDQKEILEVAHETLIEKLGVAPEYATAMLGDEFTLSQLQEVHEAILGQKLDKRNFRKRILKAEILEDTGRMETGERHRPAKLYRKKDDDS